MALTPPDPKRCQADVPGNGPFTMGGEIGDPNDGYRTRCKSKPTVIVYETEPDVDGLMGSMSLCPQCLEEFRKQQPSAHVRIEKLATKSDDWYRKKAKEQYHSPGEVEVDEGVAKVSRAGNEDGAYVEAWVWVQDLEGNDD